MKVRPRALMCRGNCAMRSGHSNGIDRSSTTVNFVACLHLIRLSQWMAVRTTTLPAECHVFSDASAVSRQILDIRIRVRPSFPSP